MKIAVAGVGYVGLSIATLLAQDNEVYAISTTQSKVDLINIGKSPIVDKKISEYLATKDLNLTATLDKEFAYANAECVVIATPTNYDTNTNSFDSHAIPLICGSVAGANCYLSPTTCDRATSFAFSCRFKTFEDLMSKFIESIHAAVNTILEKERELLAAGYIKTGRINELLIAPW